MNLLRLSSSSFGSSSLICVIFKNPSRRKNNPFEIPPSSSSARKYNKQLRGNQIIKLLKMRCWLIGLMSSFPTETGSEREGKTLRNYSGPVCNGNIIRLSSSQMALRKVNGYREFGKCTVGIALLFVSNLVPFVITFLYFGVSLIAIQITSWNCESSRYFFIFSFHPAFKFQEHYSITASSQNKSRNHMSENWHILKFTLTINRLFQILRNLRR